MESNFELKWIDKNERSFFVYIHDIQFAKRKNYNHHVL